MSRYSARLDHFDLKVQDVNDGFRRNLVRHNILYRDLPDLEDQGLKQRTIRIRCFFIRDTYEKHYEFLDHIKANKEFTLVHPKYGTLTGGIESVDVTHNHRRNTAEIDITFEEAAPRDDSCLMGDINGMLEESFTAGVKAQEESMASDIREEFGPDGTQVLEKELDPEQGILEQFAELAGAARAFVGEIDSMVSTLEGTLADISNPLNSLIATVEFATDLPGRVMGSITRTVERFTELYNTVGSAPDRFLRNLHSGLSGLEATLGLDDPTPPTTSGRAQATARAMVRKQLKVAGAQMAALELGYIFSADEETRDKARKLEGARAFDVRGNSTGLIALPEVLNAIEIERSLATASEIIQEAVDLARGMGALKEQARYLVRHVNEIKLEREKVRKIWVDNPTPIHLLCHAHGLPYNYAPRVLSLNPTIENPNFISGEVYIYER